MFINYLSKLLISNMKIFGCLLHRKNILSPYGDFCFYLISICICFCIFYKISPHCILIEPVYVLNINCFSFFPIETRLVYFCFCKPVFGAFNKSNFIHTIIMANGFHLFLYKKSTALLFYT